MLTIFMRNFQLANDVNVYSVLKVDIKGISFVQCVNMLTIMDGPLRYIKKYFRIQHQSTTQLDRPPNHNTII